MSGRGIPAQPDRVIHRFQAWSEVPAVDLLTLRRTLQRSPAAAVPGPTLESELLSIVEDEVIRRGLAAAAKDPGPPAGT